jgi:hypothetical protein
MLRPAPGFCESAASSISAALPVSRRVLKLRWRSVLRVLSGRRFEEEGTMIGDRAGLDARRLFQRVLLDFERSLRAPQPAERPPATYRDYVRQRDGAVS